MYGKVQSVLVFFFRYLVKSEGDVTRICDSHYTYMAVKILLVPTDGEDILQLS